MTKKQNHNACIKNIPFHPKSLLWRLACCIMRITFKRKVRDTRHTLKLRKKWDRSSAFLKLEPSVLCESYQHSGIQGEWIVPPSKPTAIILYLHGGGYCLGSLTTHRAYLTYLSVITNAKIFHLDYRLAPEYPFPAAHEDSIKAYAWLLKQKMNLPLFIAGDSAGGGLALATLLALRDRNMQLPNGTICFSPWADLTHQGDTLKSNFKSDHMLYAPSLPVVAKLYVGDADATNPYISPVYGDYQNLTPVFIQAAEGEILLSDSLRVFEKIKKRNGVVTLEIWQNAFHAWPYTISFLSEAEPAILKVKNFIESHQQSIDIKKIS